MTARTIRQLGFVLPLRLAFVSPPRALCAQKTQKISKNLIKRAEKSVEEIEKTEKQLEKTVKKYSDLLKKNKVKDRQKEYKKLNDELKKTDKRVGELRKRNDEVQKEANKFFTEWSKGLSKINDPQLQGDVLRFLSKKNDVWFPKLKPVPVMGTEKENHTSWERYYRVSDCSSSSRNNWYLGR